SFEQGPQRQLDLELLPHPCNDLGRDQRVPAEIEEAVQHAEPVETKEVRPEICHLPLLLRARRGERHRQIGPRTAECRESSPVDLAARGPWERVEEDDG